MSCLYPVKIQPKSYCGTAKERTVVIADCHKCPPCRAKQARKWTTRTKDELTLHPYSSFITLTYAPKCLPSGGNLYYPDVQAFLKRLRINRKRAEFTNKLRSFVER